MKQIIIVNVFLKYNWISMGYTPLKYLFKYSKT